MKGHVTHPLINPGTIERRAYQESIAKSAIGKNTLVVLPTGLGKCHGFEDLILLENGQVECIGSLVENALTDLPNLAMRNGVIALNQSKKFRIMSLTENGFEASDIIAFCKFKSEQIIEIKTESGIRIQVTPEHPLLTFNRELVWVNADQLKQNDWLVIAKKTHPAATDDKIDFYGVFRNVPGKKFIAERNDAKITGIYCRGGKSCKNTLKTINRLTPQLARFLGLVTAEAVVSGGIKFYNDDPVLLADFRTLSKNLFGLEPVKIKGGLKIRSTALVYFLRFAFGITPSHSRDKIIPKALMSAPDEVISAFLSGLFDGEGSVREDGLIEFMTASKAVAQRLPYLFLRFGIVCRTKQKKSKATNSPNPKERVYHRVYIEGKENLRLFENYVGFKHPKRKEKLVQITNSSRRTNTNVDVFPVGSLLTEIRKGLNLVTSKEKDFLQLSDFGIYERGRRNPSRAMLAYILSVFERRKDEISSISEDIEAVNNFKEILDFKKHLDVKKDIKLLLREANVRGKQYRAWLNRERTPKIKDDSPYVRFLYAAGKIEGLSKRTELQNRIKRIVTVIRISMWEFRRVGLDPTSVNPQKLLQLIGYINEKWENATASFKKIDKLKQLLNADVAFDKIKDISYIKKPGWVYDISTENGNFIAGDYGALISHNTSIAALLVAYSLERYPNKKILFLAPTKPLSIQHQNTFKSLIRSNLNLVLCTGEVNPKKRSELYKQADVIFSTPQTIKNDAENKRLSLDNFSLCVFDEAHRAVKDYAYTYVAKNLPEDTLVLGLTASPGGERQRIKEVMNNLRITNVEIRSHDDIDVSPYVQKSTITWVPVELSEHFKKIKKELDSMTSRYARKLTLMGFPPPLKHKGKFMQLRQRIMDIPHNIKYPAMVQYSALLHLLHMTELLETQGVYPLRAYLAKLEEKTSKSAKLLLREPSLEKVKELCRKEEDHPKMPVLIQQIRKLEGKKLMVFVQYRAQIARIESFLRENGINARQFVGKKEGVTRKMQEQTIADFREGKFDVMVASSIGEEGLDIPAVDAVIFYEPVPSEIRTIQRRGRAARLKEGEVVVLITKGTRDEYYYYASRNREKKMKTILSGMQKKEAYESAGDSEKKKPSGQTKMTDFD